MSTFNHFDTLIAAGVPLDHVHALVMSHLNALCDLIDQSDEITAAVSATIDYLGKVEALIAANPHYTDAEIEYFMREMKRMNHLAALAALDRGYTINPRIAAAGLA